MGHPTGATPHLSGHLRTCVYHTRDSLGDSAVWAGGTGHPAQQSDVAPELQPMSYDVVIYMGRAEGVAVADKFTSDPYCLLKVVLPSGAALDWRCVSDQ